MSKIERVTDYGVLISNDSDELLIFEAYNFKDNLLFMAYIKPNDITEIEWNVLNSDKGKYFLYSFKKRWWWFNKISKKIVHKLLTNKTKQ
jgi:hypothetical protein